MKIRYYDPHTCLDLTHAEKVLRACFHPESPPPRRRSPMTRHDPAERRYHFIHLRQRPRTWAALLARLEVATDDRKTEKIDAAKRALIGLGQAAEFGDAVSISAAAEALALYVDASADPEFWPHVGASSIRVGYTKWRTNGAPQLAILDWIRTGTRSGA